jgi:glucuronate isomerase
MLSNVYNYMHHMIESLPAVSTHSHHLPDDFHKNLTLDRIFESSYLVILAGLAEDEKRENRDYLNSKPRSITFPGKNANRRGDFLSHVRYNSYFVWLEKALQKIYGFEDNISPENWDDISSRIKAWHVDENAHLKILGEIAGYRRVIQDSYWDYASNLGHPELFSTELRTDMFIHCFHPDMVDHDGNNPFRCYPQAATTSLDDYLDFLEHLFTKWRDSGAVTMKSASAYDRTLQYDEPDRDLAARVFLHPPGQVTPAEHKAYGDFMFHWFCRLCTRLNVPFQIHTGLAKLSGSRPLLLEPIINKYPEIKFILLHAGYPWYADSAGLAHNFCNVYLDLTWVPITSTYGAVQALSEFIEVAHSSNRIAWGDDAFTSEESYGALLAWRHVVAKVLTERVEEGYFGIKEAETLATRLMYKNAVETYGLTTL